LQRCDDNAIYGNILYGCTYDYKGNIHVYSGATGTLIYNNVIYESDIGIYAGDPCTIKNNIVSGSERYDFEFNVGDAGTTDYNCFSGDGTAAVRQTATASYTVAEYFAAIGNGEHSIQEDPLFTDPDNGDFTLQGESPCIGIADKTIGDAYKIGLLPGSSWPDGVLPGNRNSY